jgi:hypothetical protein
MMQHRKETVCDQLTFHEVEGVQVLQKEPGWEVMYRGSPPTKRVLICLR